MTIFKIKHIPSGLFWKGGGMKSNNGAWNIVHKRKSKFYMKPLDSKNSEMALHICFNKVGKTWSKKSYAIVAKNYGHEPGLDLLLKECEIVEYTLTN